MWIRVGGAQVEKDSPPRDGGQDQEETERAIRQTIESYPEHLRVGAFQVVTLDSGSEGANHGALREDYGIDTYFCDPNCSRGIRARWRTPSVLCG